jgi:hypothetical protein
LRGAQKKEDLAEVPGVDLVDDREVQQHSATPLRLEEARHCAPGRERNRVDPACGFAICARRDSGVEIASAKASEDERFACERRIGIVDRRHRPIVRRVRPRRDTRTVSSPRQVSAP